VVAAPVILASGQAASVGRASGPLALSAEAASAFAARGAAPIFVRAEMDADDMAGLRVSAGVVTTRGGITGDGAVAARVLGKPCLVGVSSAVVRSDLRTLAVATADGEIVVREGDVVTLVVEGARGELRLGG
jgi:pyruvate,orthophosphate dikinase